MTDALLKEIRDLLIEINEQLKKRSLSLGNSYTTVDQQGGNLELQPWEQHIEYKNPQNDYEIIALVVERLTNNDKQAVTKNEILDFIRMYPERIKNTEPEKLSSSIYNTKNNSAYKYIEFADEEHKTYRLSIKGRQLVKRLPDTGKESKKPTKKKK